MDKGNALALIGFGAFSLACAAGIYCNHIGMRNGPVLQITLYVFLGIGCLAVAIRM